MNCENIDKTPPHVKYLWNNKITYDSFPIIYLKYMDNVIKIHEFILRDHFKTYDTMKKKIVQDDNIKELDLLEVIDFDTLNLEYKYLDLIIKYLYGHDCDIQNIPLNDLFKIHLFLTKHCMMISFFIHKIENKIHEIIYNMPAIKMDRGKNYISKYSFQVSFIIIDKINIRSELCKYGHELYVHPYNYFEESCNVAVNIKYNKIENLNELFDKYDKYLLDDEIYDYGMSFMLKKYNLDNYNYYLPNGKIYIYKKDNAEEIMKKLGYYNYMKHKYYTLSFLNKNFAQINENNIFNGHYYEYYIKYSNKLDISHILQQCAYLKK